jgi:superfamily I DNA/RNA helicase
MWADEFRPRGGSDREHEERLLYVALTRASDILIMTYSESNEFIDRMVKSGDAVGK